MNSSVASLNLSHSDDYLMHVRCPICNISLQAYTFRKREKHCNSCILNAEDGSDLSTTGPNSDMKEDQTDKLETNIYLPPLSSPISQATKRPSPRLDASKKIKVKSMELEDTVTEKIDMSTVKVEKIESAVKATAPPDKKASTDELQQSKKFPFYKVSSIGETKLAVDAFNYGAIPGVQNYYLSHFHSDHYGGLSKNWQHGLIYCSHATAKLLMLKLKVRSEYIRPLAMDTEHLIDGVKVVLLDANHCPGAVVFLFNQKVSHTGDFRATRKLINNVREYTSNLDEVYLDTTYSDPKRKFPSQDLVVNICAEYCAKQQALPISKSFFTKTPKKRRVLAVVGSYTIGKERLAVAIAHKLNGKIWGTLSKLQVLRSLDSDEINSLITEDGYESQVHITSMSELTIAKLEQKWNHLRKYFTHLIAFVPTGWTWPATATEFTEKMSEAPKTSTLTMGGQIRICRVPYSEHSSFEELEMFCNSIQCKRLIATVPTKRYDISRQWESYV